VVKRVDMYADRYEFDSKYSKLLFEIIAALIGTNYVPILKDCDLKR
jgi:hypothetical protein